VHEGLLLCIVDGFSACLEVCWQDAGLEAVAVEHGARALVQGVHQPENRAVLFVNHHADRLGQVGFILFVHEDDVVYVKSIDRV